MPDINIPVHAAPLALNAVLGKVSARRIDPRPAGPAPTAPVHPNFIYHCGPVIAHPQVRIAFVGGLWNTDAGHKSRAASLVQFCKDLLASNVMNVLSQYGVGAGQFVGSFNVGSVAATLKDSDLQTLLQNQIPSNMPEPGSPTDNVLLVYLDNNTNISDANIVF